MSRKVYVEAKVRLTIRQDDDVETSAVLDGLDCRFADTTGKAQVEDAEIVEWEVKDSK